MTTKSVARYVKRKNLIIYLHVIIGGQEGVGEACKRTDEVAGVQDSKCPCGQGTISNRQYDIRLVNICMPL